MKTPESAVLSSRSAQFRFLYISLLMFLLLLGAPIGPAHAQTPAKGQTAPDFTLSTVNGTPVQLSAETSKGTTVLVILRGYPGYQCPFCQQQAHDLITHATQFANKKITVVLVYPGPPAELDRRAKEFLSKQAALPPNVTLLTDPDYKVTNLYGVRWNAPEETAYPSTFLLDKNRTVLFERISRSHGDRVTADEVLAQVPAN
jgi:peroxiredoxin